ncbi:MAG: zinc ABC transporter substrate-binding protein [Desulfurococcales archaeon]|nr:zinc ABC transporter substrate-binding protein [Desulfurococcales archaeon]
MGTAGKISVIVIILVIVALAGGVYYKSYTGQSNTAKTGRNTLIVVTFPSLVSDVKQLTCSSETVKSIVPPGVDPHNYQLTPRDAELVKEASLIVSTGHTPFESKIRDIVNRNETRAVLIEIPEIPGIKIMNNPVTGKPNYHMPIMDPHNYLVFIKYLATQLNKIDPQCSDTHNQRLMSVEREVDSLLKYEGKFNETVVASDPTVQYQVSWLGLRVKYLFTVEHGTPASFEELSKISQALVNGEVHCIVVSSSASQQLQKLINSMSIKEGMVKIVYVPGPLAEGSIPGKLNMTINNIENCTG